MNRVQTNPSLWTVSGAVINRTGTDCWAELRLRRDESCDERKRRALARNGLYQTGVKRVMSNPAKIAAAPAIWLPEIGSPSQIAATMIATIGVR